MIFTATQKICDRKDRNRTKSQIRLKIIGNKLITWNKMLISSENSMFFDKMMPIFRWHDINLLPTLAKSETWETFRAVRLDTKIQRMKYPIFAPNNDRHDANRDLES